MQNDDDERGAQKAIEGTKGNSWVLRAFNPPKYDLAIKGKDKLSYIPDFRPKSPNRIGDNVRLFSSPESTRKILSFVVGDETATTLYSLAEGIHTRNEEALNQAALSNWFIQPETPYQFFDTLTACKKDETSIKDAFTKMMRSQIENIRDRLIKDFPHRAEILQEGFALHVEQRFLASIPLFIMMAEGIATENTGKSIFSPGRGKEKGHKPPQIFCWLEDQKLSTVAKIYSGALQVEHPFSRGAKEGHLSRHAVLHGNSTDYGTEIFSLQAISILGLVGWVFSENGLVSG